MENLLAFTALEADADVFGIPGLVELPSIKWKRRNLEALRAQNGRKFAANVAALARVLGLKIQGYDPAAVATIRQIQPAFG